VQQLLQSFGSGHTVQLDVVDDSRPASAGSLLQAASDVVAANPDVAVKVLDHSALKVQMIQCPAAAPVKRLECWVLCTT
jgi:hypothetical protein